MSFNQLAPSVPTVINASNVFVYGNTSSGNALSVQQLGAGNVFRFSNAAGLANVMVMNNLGQVGIGTTNPQYPLDIAGQPRYSIQPVLQSTQLGIASSAAAGWYRIASLGPTARAKFRIYTSGANLQEQVVVTTAWSAAFSGYPALRIEDQSSATFAGTQPLYNGQVRTVVNVNSNGTWYLEVYLGTVAVAYTLYVQLIEGDASGASITLTSPIVAGSIPTNYTAQPTVPVNAFSVTPWNTTSNVSFLITNNGNIGIGTTNPDQILTISAPSASQTAVICKLVNAFTSNSAYINFTNSADSRSAFVGQDGTGLFAYATGALAMGTNTDVPVIFAPNYNSGGEKVRITGAGRVGIGTANPREILQVNSTTSTTPNTRLSGGATWGTSAFIFDNILSGYWHINGYGNNPTTSARGAAYAAGQIICGSETNNNYENSYMAFQVCVDPQSDGTGGLGVTTERMRIKSNGNVGIGTASPGYPLEVSGAAYMSGTVYVGTTNVDPTLGRVNGINLRSDGRIFSRSAGHSFGIDSTSGTQIQFWTDNGSTRVATGAITSSGATTSYTSASDYRLKENVQPITGALNIISSLNPVTYTWKSDGSPGHGFIAHELQEVVPDAVVGEKDAVNSDGTIKPQNVDKTYIISYLTAAIQELSTENTQLKARLDSLEQRLAAAGL